MAYSAWSVVAGEQPTAAKWNILGTNDASFNDGTGIASLAITTAKLNTASVTPDKLATGGAVNGVATSQTTTSTGYTDLGTLGGTVAVTIGANGMALVSISALLQNSISGKASKVSYTISGATTLAASDTFGTLQVASTAGFAITMVQTRLITGLTAGSNTFTMKYCVDGGTGTFQDRYISVIPL